MLMSASKTRTKEEVCEDGRGRESLGFNPRNELEMSVTTSVEKPYAVKFFCHLLQRIGTKKDIFLVTLSFPYFSFHYVGAVRLYI